jgi:hypothetical protein
MPLISVASDQAVGLVAEPSSGSRIMRNGVPAPVGVFERLQIGDEMMLEDGASVSLVYFSSRRKENISAPARIRVGAESSEILSGRVEIDILPASAPISAELAQSGTFRFAGAGATSRRLVPPLSGAARDEIARAMARYEAWHRDAAATDTLPELYVLSVLDKYGQLESMPAFLDRLDVSARRAGMVADLAARLREQVASRTTVTVGITPITSPSGDNIGQELAALLESSPSGSARHWRVAPLQGDALQMTSQTTRSAVLRDAARKARAEYAVIGVMGLPSVADGLIMKNGTECVKTRLDKDGETTTEQCTEWKPTELSCTRRSAEWRLELTVLDTQSGRTLATDTVRGRASGDGCAALPPPGQDVLFQEARKDLLNKVRSLINAKALTSPARFARPDAMEFNPRTQEEFIAALAKAAEGDIGAACDTFNRLAVAERVSSSIAFNAATCEEEAGRFDSALSLYRSAESNAGPSHPEIAEALERVQTLSTNLGGAPGAGQLSATSVRPSSIQEKVQSSLLQPTLATAVERERRIALVIGNSGYPKGSLRNPVNDARDVARALAEIDFEVIKLENAPLEAMNRAIDQFALRAKQFHGVALIFYAGHGMQVEGENFLIPVDADFTSEREITYRAINLGLVLAKMEQAESRVNIVILDACRDNPFARTLRSARRGLASVDAPKGTVIAYATAPGRTASDGEGRNGLYSSHLVRELHVPGLRIEDVFKRVRSSVAQDSHDLQIPWESSSLTGDFYFRR